MPNNRIIFVFKAIVMSVFILVILGNYSKIPPQIPLFYSLATTETQVTGSLYLILIPIVGVIFLFLNDIMLRFFKDNDLLINLVQIINIIIITSMCAIVIKIILLVT